MLVDLDDTILEDDVNADASWRQAFQTTAASSTGVNPDRFLATIKKVSDWYYSDQDRFRAARLDLATHRREVATIGLQRLGIQSRPLAGRIAEEYAKEKHNRVKPFPGAVEALEHLRVSGLRLGLVTNGSSSGQRNKIERFNLVRLFDGIFIEGEIGFGKPDERMFQLAIQQLGSDPDDTWMVGDRLQSDVAAAQHLGLCGIWVDCWGSGLPRASQVIPDAIVPAFDQVLSLL